MSLEITISVLQVPIEEITVVRTEDYKGSDRVYRYTVRHKGLLIGFVWHRYSEGAFVLAQKVLTLMTESLS